MGCLVVVSDIPVDLKHLEFFSQRPDYQPNFSANTVEHFIITFSFDRLQSSPKGVELLNDIQKDGLPGAIVVFSTWSQVGEVRHGLRDTRVVLRERLRDERVVKLSDIPPFIETPEFSPSDRAFSLDHNQPHGDSWSSGKQTSIDV